MHQTYFQYVRDIGHKHSDKYKKGQTILIVFLQLLYLPQPVILSNPIVVTAVHWTHIVIRINDNFYFSRQYHTKAISHLVYAPPLRMKPALNVHFCGRQIKESFLAPGWNSFDNTSVTLAVFWLTQLSERISLVRERLTNNVLTEFLQYNFFKHSYLLFPSQVLLLTIGQLNPKRINQILWLGWCRHFHCAIILCLND